VIDPLFEPANLEADAIYLGVLTARGIKPLSRLEYPVGPDVLLVLERLGLTLAVVRRAARDGTRRTHRVMSANPATIRRYVAEFDCTILCRRAPSVVRAEARYFGYPSCCAEAFISEPHAQNDLPWSDQRLLFHHACPACVETPRLVPLYRAAYVETLALVERLARARGRSALPPVDQRGRIE
jgi:hypothetical protein